MTTLREKPAKAAADEFPGRRASSPLRPHVLGAIFRRNLLGYFSNPAGYVFLTLFVLVCSWAEFLQPAFFANNLANLDPLDQWMPYILLFFVPAITMGTWAEERRQGTDELLLTLPARDIEVVLGKYFAALGIFTAAIFLLALGHVPILAWLGDPDYGVLAANYLGYWLIGAMLIALGMVASMLSTNVTVAFILGAVFCAVPVFMKLIGSPSAGAVRRFLEGLSVSEQFRDFGSGVVPISGVFYFVSLAVGALYLNMVLLGRRHWAGGRESGARWGHAAARVFAITLALVSLDVIVSKAFASWRLDTTEERSYSLSPVTVNLIKQIPKDRPVFIQAYVSPEVPREYVQTRLDLINTLKEYAAIGGDRIRLNLVPTERYSEAARDAEKRFGITPRPVTSTEDTRQRVDQGVFLGVAFNSGAEEVVIPFFDRGLPVEYEITRSIRVASATKRKKVGVLTTDARLIGAADFASRNPQGEWKVVTELKKQYEVTEVSPDEPIKPDIDALIVAQPSSLPQRGLATLTEYIRQGRPTLLLMDPLTPQDPSLSPSEPRTPPAGGGMFGGPQVEPKGNLRPLMDLLGIDWQTDQIVWNPTNPHPQIKDQVTPDVLFVFREQGGVEPFSTDPVTAKLQELVFIFAGSLQPKRGASTDFLPLVKTNDAGGTTSYDDLLQQSMMGRSLRRDRPYVPGQKPYILAAKISGTLPAEPPPIPEEGKTAPPPAKPAKAHVIAVADLDVFSDTFYGLRLKENEGMDQYNLDFDNITFLLNCVDDLAGDDTFIALRSRRAKHRPLKFVEEQSKKFVEEAIAESDSALRDSKKQIEEARERLKKQVAEVEGNKELDARTKESIIESRRETEQRKLTIAIADIEDKARRRVEDSTARKEQGVRGIENRIRLFAFGLPLVAPILLGLMVFFVRSSQENRGASPNRLAS